MIETKETNDLEGIKGEIQRRINLVCIYGALSFITAYALHLFGGLGWFIVMMFSLVSFALACTDKRYWDMKYHLVKIHKKHKEIIG